MKKFYKKITQLSLIISLALMGHTAICQTILNENFDYGKEAGKLTVVSGGKWENVGRHKGFPIGYATTSLSMNGYPSSGVGGSLIFENGREGRGNNNKREDVERKFTEQKTGFIYVSTLINFSSSSKRGDYTFTLRGEKRYRVRGFFKDDGKGKLKFGIRKNSRGTITYSKGEYQYNKTYLLVYKYNFAIGEVSLYVLPSVSTTEPVTPDAKVTSGGAIPSINAIGIRQHGKASKGTIDGIRVGTTWKSIMTKHVTTATLKVTGKINDFGNVKKGENSTAQKFSLSGTGITEDVVIKASEHFEVSLDNKAFNKEVKITKRGTVATTDVHVRFAPNSGGNGVIKGKITISSTGATSKTVDVAGTETGNNPVAISTIRPVNDKGIPTKKGQKVFIKGKMLGYDQREKSTGFQIVINDGTGGVVLRSTATITTEKFLEGDEVEVTGTVGFFRGTTQLSSIKYITKKSTGNKRPAPKTVTKLDETTEQELIKLENVTITDKTKWTGKAGNTKGFNIPISFGNAQKATLRIENYGSDLHTKTYQEVFGDKTTGINLVGIGGQYDRDDPFTSGYQILVYKKEDISNFSVKAILTVSGTLTDFGKVNKGEKSTSQKISVAGEKITADIVIKAPNNFEVSLDNKAFNKEVKITKKGTVASTDVHVRFAPNSGGNGVIKGKITIFSTGATSKTIDVTGTETGNNPVAISTIRPVNDKGIPTKKGQKVFIKGKMLGYDQRVNKTGFQIVINDGTGGVMLRTTAAITTEKFVEGDEVEVTGTVGFFNGTTQLGSITSIVKKSTGNKRPAPKTVTQLDESTEQELIKLENVTITDKTKWAGKADNTSWFNVPITFGTGKKGTLRVENNPGNLHTKTYQEVFGDKTTGINLVGIGGQYDRSEPYNEGYQILVYKKEDITFSNSKRPSLEVSGSLKDFGKVNKGEKSTSQKFTIKGIEITHDIIITAPNNFEVSLDNKSFTKEEKITKKGEVPATDVHVRFVPNSDAGLLLGGKINITSVGADAVSINVSGTQVENVTSIDDDLTEAGGKLYPNPINTGYLMIELPSDYTHTALVEIFSIKGDFQLSKSIQKEGNINISSLNQGIYIAKILMGDRVLTQKVIVTK